MLIRMVVALGLMLMLLAIPAAQAASFDCAKAATPFEEAICGDPTLSDTDEVLAVAYATAIGGLTDEATNVMRKAQREWIGYLADVCADDVLPDYEAIEIERTSCLQSAYDSRIRDLESSRMLGGLRFYLSDRFKALRDETGDSWVKVGTKETSFPYIDGTTEESRAFNAIVDDLAEDYDDLFDPGVPSNDEINNSSETSDNDASVTVDAVTSGRISLQLNEYSYGHGAAHGNYSITYLHYLRAEQRPLEASDVFAGRAWKRKLAALAFDQLKASFGDGLFIESADDIAESVADPTHWDFSEEGLIVRFQPYEVTAYAAGAPTVTIPWMELDADLTQSAYLIIY
jgi:uncharacterized protein YecT (DUF1311 family)